MTDKDFMSNENFMEYLKKHKPYLYDLEMQINRLQRESGFGDISVVLNMTNNVVDRGEMIVSAKKIYVKRTHNRLTIE